MKEKMAALSGFVEGGRIHQNFEMFLILANSLRPPSRGHGLTVGGTYN